MSARMFHKNGCVSGAALAAINYGDTAGAGIAAKAAPTMGLIEFMKHPGQVFFFMSLQPGTHIQRTRQQ